jgi:hypothetical protein
MFFFGRPTTYEFDNLTSFFIGGHRLLSDDAPALRRCFYLIPVRHLRLLPNVGSPRR